MPTDKRIESAHFKSFRYFVGDALPDGPVTHIGAFGERAPAGAPDFLIHADREILGIEHREILKLRGSGERQRAHEQSADEMLRIAHELAELRGLRPAHVSVFFSRDVHISKGDRPQFARALVGVVHKHYPPDMSRARLDYSQLRGKNLAGIDAVHIYRDDRYKGPGLWNAPRAGWVVSDCVQLLQEAIDDKATKYPAYRRHCSQCWLLLVAVSFKPSAAIHPDERSLAHEYRSPFERTYFLDYGMGRLHMLRTTP